MFRIARTAVDLNKHESYLLAHAPVHPPEEPPSDAPIDPPGIQQDMPAEDEPQATPEPEAPAVPLPDIEAIRREAREIIETARREAEGLIETARTDCAAIRDAAHQEGYAQGERAALDEGKRRTDEEIAAWIAGERSLCDQMMAELDALRGGMFDTMEAHVLQLSLAIGEKVIGAVIDRDDALFPGMVRRAIEQIQSAGRILVHVSGEDYQRYFSGGSFTMELHDESVRISISEDPALARGSCIVETPNEMIDACIRTQLNIIREAFNQGSPERMRQGDS